MDRAALVRAAPKSWLHRAVVDPTLEAVTRWLRRNAGRILGGAIEALEPGPVGKGVLVAVALGAGVVLAPKAATVLLGEAALALGLYLGRELLRDLCPNCWRERAPVPPPPPAPPLWFEDPFQRWDRRHQRW